MTTDHLGNLLSFDCVMGQFANIRWHPAELLWKSSWICFIGSKLATAISCLSIISIANLAAVARGDVEIGFNQISEILAVPSVELVGPLPAVIQNYTLFTAAIVTSSKQWDAAKAFIAFISSPASAAVMKAKGF